MRVLKVWIVVALALVGAAAQLIWPPAAVALTFVSMIVAIHGTLTFNVLANRIGSTFTCLIHAFAVYNASGSKLLGLAVLAAALALTLPGELVMRHLGKNQSFRLAPPLGLAVGIGLLIAAWPTGAWGWAAAPVMLAATALGVLGWTGLVDTFKADRALKGARVGEPAPDFALPMRLEKAEFRLSQERGRFVLICFLRGDWCPACQVFMRIYQKEAVRLKENNVKLVVVSPSSGPEAEAFARDLGVDYVVLVDEEFRVVRLLGALQSGKDKGAQAPLPISVLIDPEGIVRFVSKPEDVSFFSSQAKLQQLLNSATAAAPAVA